eukprot:GHVS01069881.1.p1 GENE.GHVS01069881.1~~GHVS01069881.1.p1  ORF type:complete len:785 (-),score=104.56 GHVS01069881.1:172-2388(-)
MALALDPYSCVIVAVPKSLILGVTIETPSTENEPYKEQPTSTVDFDETPILLVDFDILSSDPVEPQRIMNNLSPLLPLLKDVATTDDSASSAEWNFQPTDNFFGWKGKSVPHPVIQVQGQDIVNTPFLLKEDLVHLVRCSDGNCYVFHYLKQIFLDKLENVKDDVDGPFAVLLNKWIDADPSVLDPWQTIPVHIKWKALNAEEKIRKRALDQAQTTWKELANKMKEVSAGNIDDAVKVVDELYRASAKLSDVAGIRAEVTRSNVRETQMDHALKELADERSTSTLSAKEFVYSDLKDAQQRVLTNDVVVQCVYSFAEHRLRAAADTHRVMRLYQTMWEKLYQEQQQSTDVYESRVSLIKAGHTAFEELKDEGMQANKLKESHGMGNYVKTAFQTKINMLSMAAARRELTDIESFTEEERNQADLAAIRMLLRRQEEMVKFQKDMERKLTDMTKKLMAVFGDFQDDKVPIDEKKAEGDVAEMVRIVRHRGYELGKFATECVEGSRALADECEASAQQCREAIQALERGEPENVPQKVATALKEWSFEFAMPANKMFPTETFDFLQMALAVIPTSAIFDSWYHLCIEALKEFFASGKEWDKAQWNMELLSGEAIKTSPHFLANKSLRNMPMPRLVADYWLRLTQDKVEPKDSDQCSLWEFTTGTKDEAYHLYETSDTYLQDEAAEDDSKDAELRQLPAQATVETGITTKTVALISVSVALCTAMIAYTCVVAVLGRGPYA